jgi:hypothetical protein
MTQQEERIRPSGSVAVFQLGAVVMLSGLLQVFLMRDVRTMRRG